MVQAYFRCVGSCMCPLDLGCGGTGMAKDLEVAFCIGENCEELMWCQCTGAGWARLAAVQG